MAGNCGRGVGILAMLWAILAGGGCRSGESTASIPAVSGLEPARYMGQWYEIARLPHSFERGLQRVRAEYRLREDGRIDVCNRGMRGTEPREVRGIAFLKDEQPPYRGELRVSFFRPFYGDYRIIALSPDYRWAVVTSGTRDYLWILARTPTLPEAELGSLLTRCREWGFEVDRLEFPEPAEPES